MTQAEIKSNGKAAPLHAALLQRRKIAHEDDWVLAQLLYSLRRYELWRFTSGGLDSWEDYLKQPEVSISRHKADKLIRIYEYFVVEHNLPVSDLSSIPWSALDLTSKKRPAEEKLADILNAAEVLTLKDFKEAFFDLTEEGDRTYSFVLMKKCDQTGNLEKVHNITSDQIKAALSL